MDPKMYAKSDLYRGAGMTQEEIKEYKDAEG